MLPIGPPGTVVPVPQEYLSCGLVTSMQGDTSLARGKNLGKKGFTVKTIK